VSATHHFSSVIQLRSILSTAGAPQES